MKQLPPIHGLLREAKRREIWASQEAEKSRSTRCDPRSAHEAGESADKHAKEAAELREMASADADMIVQISAITNYLRVSPKQSALRTLCLRKLEDAEMILRREIGDPGEK